LMPDRIESSLAVWNMLIILGWRDQLYEHSHVPLF
jgi:hypothetical protein